MAGCVLLATALHAAVGGVLWLGNSFGDTRPALPVSDIIMIEVVSEPVTAAKETVGQPEPVEPEEADIRYESRPQYVIVAPTHPLANISGEPDSPPGLEAPEFEMPVKKPVPEPEVAESQTAELTPKAAVAGPIPFQRQSVPVSRKFQVGNQSGGQADMSAGGDIERSVSPPAGSTSVTYAHNPEPAYPREARRLRQEGVVVLRVEVSPNGRALSVELKESSGHPLLDRAAQQAIRAWRFAPATRGGDPVRSMVEIPVRFYLSKG